MAEYIQRILEFLGVVFLEPISGLDYIHPTISIIQDNKITSWVKHIAVPISCIHGQFDIQKIWPTKILTHIQPSVMGERVKSLSMVFFLNKISLKSMVHAYNHMKTLIIFIRLVSIFTLCIGPHSPKIFDQTTLPCFYPVITLSSSSTPLLGDIKIMKHQQERVEDDDKVSHMGEKPLYGLLLEQNFS